VKQTALEYLRYGLQAIPASADKRPLGKWTELQRSPLTIAELSTRYDQYDKAGQVGGLGLITGQVSQGLEVIDVDCKYDLTGALYSELKRLLDDNLPELVSRLVIATTRSGGYHIYYRSAGIEGNQKLARRPTTTSELAAHPNEKVKVLIETRGEGGFIVVPPSPGYQFVQGGFDAIPVLTAEERATLLAICRGFNEEVEPEPAPVRSNGQQPPAPGGDLSPFADYNLRGDLLGLLSVHGWREAFRSGPRTHLKRPGETSAATSANFHEGLRKLFVFSTSTVFESEKGISPADAYILLECNGDKSEAARKLRALGYGTPSIYRSRSRVSTSHIRVEASNENGEGENLAPDDTLTEEAVKGAKMEAAYLYYTSASPVPEVLASLDLIERSSPVKVYLVEVADLADTSAPIDNMRPYEYRAQDIINRYAAAYDSDGGNLSPEVEDGFIHELISLTNTLADPIDRARAKQLIYNFSETNGLGITPAAIDEKVKQRQADLQREKQGKELDSLLTKAGNLSQQGKLSEALTLLQKQGQEVRQIDRAGQFDNLLKSSSESELAARLQNKPGDLRTGLVIDGIELEIPVGAISVFAAPTSHGKTTLLINTALRLTHYQPKTVYVLSYEEDADSVLVSAMNTYINRGLSEGLELSTNGRKTIKSYYREGGNKEYIKTQAREQFDDLRNRFFSELIDERRLVVQYVDYGSMALCDALYYLHKYGNAGAVIIDYIQLISKEEGKHASRQAELKDICQDLKNVAVNTGLPIILGAQFNRQVVNAARMHPTYIGEAGDIERIANLILGFWNNNMKPLAAPDEHDSLNKLGHEKDAIYVELLKYRSGKPGTAGMLSFNGNTGVIDNMKKSEIFAIEDNF
jgi:hypothetical protein